MSYFKYFIPGDRPTSNVGVRQRSFNEKKCPNMSLYQKFLNYRIYNLYLERTKYIIIFSN